MSLETDIRILDELAQEIIDHGYPGLPGSLRSLIKGARCNRVAKLLEDLARERNNLKYLLKMAEESHKIQEDGLREENQRLTDLLLQHDAKSL